MAKKLFYLILLVSIPGTALADDSTSSAPDASSVSESQIPSNLNPYARVDYITSRAGQRPNARNMKQAGTGDDGSMSESSTLPNLNYISAMGSITPAENQTAMLASLVSLDSDAARVVPTNRPPIPGKRPFMLPEAVFVGRYGYTLNQHWSLSAGETYVNTFGVQDPTIGATWRNRQDTGWSQRAGLGLSVPATQRSESQKLITRATARTGLNWTNGTWSTFNSASYSRPFYMDPSALRNSRDDDPNNPYGSGAGGGVGNGGGTGSGGIGRRGKQGSELPLGPRLEEIDIVLGERETSRTSASTGVAYAPAQHWRLASAAGATYLTTAVSHSLWLVSTKVLGVAYEKGNFNAGSEFDMYSDITKYNAPSLPRFWNVGMYVGCSFGKPSRGI